jgi:hypothetical protein
MSHSLLVRARGSESDPAVSPLVRGKGGGVFDLAWGFGLLSGLALSLFCLGSHLGRVCAVPIAKGIGLAAVAGLASYITLLADNVRLAAILPVSNLIVVGNWIPLLTSFLAGLAWSLLPRQEGGEPAPPATPGEPASGDDFPGPLARPGRGLLARSGTPTVLARRLAVVLSLQAVGWTAAIRPVWGTPPTCRDRWEGDFCLQTTDSSCSAACAATLLKAHGIDATEGEMARLCLTRRGTLWQGLYRGLRRKTAGTPRDVEVVHGSFDGLRSMGGPAILAVGLPRDAKVARVYTERYGWTPGEWHSVLFFGIRGGGRVAMGDPTPGIGREDWTEDDLRVLWEGSGMRLVRRAR